MPQEQLYIDTQTTAVYWYQKDDKEQRCIDTQF